MASLITNIQDRVKTSSNAISLLIFKALSGSLLGVTLALIGDEIVGYGWYSFVLVVVVTVGAGLRIMRGWSWTQVFIMNLICVLIGLLLRMYILIAPG